MFVGSVQNSGMFVAHDMKTHASLPTSKRVREACLSVVNDFLLATRQAPTIVARARNSQHRFRDQTRAGIGRFFAKKGSGAYPSAVGRADRATGNLSGRLDSEHSGPAQGPASALHGNLRAR